MAKELVVSDQELKGTGIPLVVELDIVGVDKGEFLIYTSVQRWQLRWGVSRLTWCLGCKDVL